MKEEKLQVFLDGVQKYFAQMIAGEELVVGTPYLIENKIPSAKDFTGVIAISGKNQGVVYFTAPKELLERLLVLIGEKDTSEALMVDLVGARSEFGEEFEISVPIVLRGAPDEILLPRKDRSFVIPITWRNRGAAIVISLRK